MGPWSCSAAGYDARRPRASRVSRVPPRASPPLPAHRTAGKHRLACHRVPAPLRNTSSGQMEEGLPDGRRRAPPRTPCPSFRGILLRYSRGGGGEASHERALRRRCARRLDDSWSTTLPHLLSRDDFLRRPHSHLSLFRSSDPERKSAERAERSALPCKASLEFFSLLQKINQGCDEQQLDEHH